MPSKLQMYEQMADQTAKQVTGSFGEWTAFLETMGRLYKYPFHEQLMIFAQKPNATACADYDLWKPDSFRRENIIGITRFVDRYHDSYIPQRLITRLSNVDPLTIPREGRAVGVDIAGYKKYLYQVWKIYNGSGKKYSLPKKF